MKRSFTPKSRRLASLLAAAGLALTAALSSAAGAQAGGLSVVPVTSDSASKPISGPIVISNIGWGGCGTCGK